MDLEIFLFLSAILWISSIMVAFAYNFSIIMREYGWHPKVLIKCLGFMLLFSLLDAALISRVLSLLK